MIHWPFLNISKDYTTYWNYNSWTFFFFSYDNTPGIYDTFGYLQTPASDFWLSGSNFLPGEPLKQPDSTSRMYFGGSSTGGQGCRCKLAQVRFYSELFVKGESLMTKFSDYGTGKFIEGDCDNPNNNCYRNHILI